MLDSIPDEKRKCHRCNFDKSCRDLVLSGACQRWFRIDGLNPQTGAHMEKYACIDDHIPYLLLEIGQQARQGGAATESMRNEIVKRMDGIRPIPNVHNALTHAANTQMLIANTNTENSDDS